MAIFNSYVSHYQRVTGLDFTVAMIQGSSGIIAQLPSGQLQGGPIWNLETLA